MRPKGGWLGFTDKYWLTSLIPPQNEAIKARFTHTVDAGVDRYQTDYLGPEVNVAPDGTAESSARFFAGAKEVNLLDAYKDSGNFSVRPRHRFRLVLFLDEANFSDPAIFLCNSGQFRISYSVANLVRQATILPACEQIL